MSVWDRFAFCRSAPHGTKRPSTGPPSGKLQAGWPLIWETVIMPQSNPFASGESRIVDVKSDLSRISKDRLLAYREGRIDEAARQQFRLLEAELRNIEALASYVKLGRAAVVVNLLVIIRPRQSGSMN